MAQAKKKSNMYWIHIVIFLVISFGVGFLPPFGMITPLGMRVLGVFIGVIYAWCFISLSWPSLLGLCLLPLVGYQNATSLFAAGWGFQVLPQIVLGFILAECIAQTNFVDWLTDKILTVKLFKGRPFVMLGGLCVATMVMALMQTAYAGLFIIWDICRAISEKAGYPRYNKFNVAACSSTTAVFVWTAFIFPFNPGVLAFQGFWLQGMPGVEVPFVGWLLLWLIFTCLYCLIWPIICKFILRLKFPEIAALDPASLQQGEKVRMTFAQKYGLIVLCCFVAVMLLQKIMPATWPITQILLKLNLTGCFIIAIAFLVAYRDNEGKHIVSIQEASKGISWDVMCLLIATEPLATALQSGDCGILGTVMAWAVPAMSALPLTLILVICVIVFSIITQVIHNLVLMAIFIPILCPLYLQLGGNPYVMYIALVVAFSSAFTTPAASWNSALMFGADMGESKQLYAFGFTNFIFSIVLYFVSAFPLSFVLLPWG